MPVHEASTGGPVWPVLADRFAPGERVLSTILKRQAERYGNRTLLVFGDIRWSYADTAAIAAASAQRLMQAGIRAGDRVALMCSNRAEFLEVYLGCAWMGAVTVPINTALRGTQLAHIFRNSTPQLLVAESSFLPAFKTLEDGVATPARIWTIGENAPPPGLKASILPLPPLADGIPPPAIRPGDTVARAYAARRRKCFGGASIPRARSESAKAMSCSRRCRFSTPTP